MIYNLAGVSPTPTLVGGPPPSVTDWISAIATAGLGFLGLVFGTWQWRHSRFKPKLKARVDGAHQAIELAVRNRGRAAGVLQGVLISESRDTDVLLDWPEFDGFNESRFEPQTLPPYATMRVVIKAPEGHRFPDTAELIVLVGLAIRHVRPKVDKNVGLFGVASVLPPQS